LSPLADPTGVGDAIEAKDPSYASDRMSEAAEKTARALTVPEDEAEMLLLDVFGDPDLRAAITGEGPVSVSPTGALVGGIAMSGGRAIPTVRSHGDGG
jgi:hypothetical protein